MPPLSRNHRVPTAWDTPHTTAASSLDSPTAIAFQNRCRCSRRATGGRPGDRIGGLAIAAAAQPRGRPIHTPLLGMLRRPVESALAAVVGVADQAGWWLSLADGHLQGVQDQFSAQVVGHRPANDPTRERVQDHGEVQPALVGALLGNVGDPELIGTGRCEPALDEIWCRRRGGIAPGQPTTPPTVDALQAVLAHDAGDAFAADMDAQAQAQLGVDAWGAVGATAAVMDLADLFAEQRIRPRPVGWWAAGPGVVARARHTEHAGELGDRVVGFLRIDQPVAAHRRSVSL